MNPLVELLAGELEAAANLLAEHHDDGSGHCRVCKIGAQAGFKVWPCAIFGAAEAAVEMVRWRR